MKYSFFCTENKIRVRFSFHLTDDNQFSALNQETSLNNISTLSPISCQLRGTFQDVLGCHGHEESAPLWHVSRERETRRWAEGAEPNAWVNRQWRESFHASNISGRWFTIKWFSYAVFLLIVAHKSLCERPKNDKLLSVYADCRHVIIKHIGWDLYWWRINRRVIV